MGSKQTQIMTTSQPPDHLAAFRRQAKASGLTLSEWVGAACQKQLSKEDRQRLTARRKPGYAGGGK